MQQPRTVSSAEAWETWTCHEANPSTVADVVLGGEALKLGSAGMAEDWCPSRFALVRKPMGSYSGLWRCVLTEVWGQAGGTGKHSSWSAQME